MKFIHIADVHLGVKPDAGRPWSEKRAHDIWDSLAEVIEVCDRERPELLLIAGDLFHAQPLKKELKEVNRLFAGIPGTKVVLMAGNHDFLRPQSYLLTYPWAENVFVFKREEADFFDFPDINVRVYGISYWHREIREPLYNAMLPEQCGRINILLAHGGDEKHIPFSPDKLLSNGFDYVAAGHIHKGGQLAAGRAVMAGSLEPTDCNDTGPHGYWKGELLKGSAAVRFYPVKKCEYCHEAFAVRPETTEREVLKWAEELIENRPAYQYFRLFLEGSRDPDLAFDLEELKHLERVVDVVDHLTPDYDYEKLALEHRGTLLEGYIHSLRSGQQDIVRKKALEFGVEALLGNKL